MPSLDEPLWRAADVASYLRMSIHWVRKASQKGTVPFLRIGGHSIRYEPERIRAWAEAQRGDAVSLKR